MEKMKHEVLVQNWAQNIEQRINSGMNLSSRQKMDFCQKHKILLWKYIGQPRKKVQ